MSMLGEATRMSLYWPEFSGIPKPNVSDYRSDVGRIYHSYLIFAIAASYDILPAFYEKTHLYNPVVSTDKMVNFGKTSFQHLCTATSEKTGQLLHQSILQIVLVDKETRRPVALPDFLKDHFKAFDTTQPFERVAPMETPELTHTRQYTVRWSDTDYYMHLNQASYVRICFDALVEVSRAGCFSALEGDIGKYWVKNYKCYYQNESTPGDVLDIHMWENPVDPMVVHAIAEKEGKSIFQSSFQFINPK